MEHTVSKGIKGIDHIVLTTANINACLAFYTLLGFEIHDEGFRYFLQNDHVRINVHLLGHEVKPNAHIAKPGTLDVCFEVHGDVTDWKEMFEKHAIQTSEISMKSGLKGSMHSFYLRDPDQNLIELCTYKDNTKEEV